MSKNKTNTITWKIKVDWIKKKFKRKHATEIKLQKNRKKEQKVFDWRA